MNEDEKIQENECCIDITSYIGKALWLVTRQAGAGLWENLIVTLKSMDFNSKAKRSLLNQLNRKSFYMSQVF